MSVRVLLLGPPAIEIDGRSFVLPFERRSQLVVYLALKRQWVGRPELATLLWPEQPPKSAYMNLRKTLHRLPLLPWSLPLRSEGGALHLEVDTDVVAFEAALQAGDEATALRLRRGVLLAGFDDDAGAQWSSWLAFERERLHAAWRQAAIALLSGAIEPARALALCAELLGADPLDEGAALAQLSWLWRSGQAARAREAYREFAARLQSELGVEPSAQMQALEAQLAALPGGSAGPAGATPAATAEPPAAGDFVGRGAELRQLGELLARPQCRLLSLVGPGGVGKTRLARRLLQCDGGKAVPAGLLVPLEDVAGAAEVGARIARELGLALSGSGDPLDQIAATLGGREWLLVLDNLDHLAAEASFVERLLGACARLKIVVTSRVRLSLAAEWLFPLDGLPCPEPEDLDRLDSFDASRLFVRAARRVEPALGAGVEAVAIGEICRLVDGLPLALLLAASWTRVLSCQAIADEIRQGSDLLRTADPTRPARHASIAAVFESSWRLLSAREREALARLSVFRGGFSFEDSRAVTAAALPVLASLVDKSLLRKEAGRLTMHPLVQQFATLRLGQGSEREAAERAHAGHFHRRMLQLRRGVENGSRDALRQMEADFENCRAAWRSALARGAVDVVRGCVPALSHFADHQCRFSEGRGLMLEALESPAVRADGAASTLLQAHAALLECRMERYADAEARAQQAHTLARQLHYQEGELQCLRVLGTACMRRSRYDEARRHFEQALQLAPAEVDPQFAADMLVNLAATASYTGDYDEALRLSAEALPLFRRLGDLAGETSCLHNMGLQHHWKDEPAAAQLRLHAALQLSEQHGLVTLRASALGGLVTVARQTGDFTAAERHALAALEIAQANGYRGLAASLKFDLVHIALHRGDLAAARATLAAALELAAVIGRPTLLAAGVSWGAEILAAQREPAAACAVLEQVIAHPATNGPERERYRERQKAWQAAVPARLVDFDTLVHRFIAEADVGYAPLIAALHPPASPPARAPA